MKAMYVLASTVPLLLSIIFASLSPRVNVILRIILRVTFLLTLLASLVPSWSNYAKTTIGVSPQMGLLLLIVCLEFLAKKYLKSKGTFKLTFVEESILPVLLCFFVYTIGIVTKDNYSYFLMAGFLFEYFQCLVKDNYRPLNLDIVRLLIGLPFLIYTSFIGWDSLSLPDMLILWTILNKSAPFSLSKLTDPREFLVGKKVFLICIILLGLPTLSWTPLLSLVSLGLSLVMLSFSLFSKVRDKSWQNLKGLIEFLLLLIIISSGRKALDENILVLAWSEFLLISIYCLSRPLNLKESLLTLICTLFSLGLFCGPMENLFNSALIQSTLWGNEHLLIGALILYWMGFIAYSYNWMRFMPKDSNNRKISHLEYLYLPSVIIIGLILSI